MAMGSKPTPVSNHDTSITRTESTQRHAERIPAISYKLSSFRAILAWRDSGVQGTEIPDEEWDHTLATNLSALFHLTKAALAHMRPGAHMDTTAGLSGP